MSPINIFTLPAPRAPAQAGTSSGLRDSIEAGLLGTAEPTIPGTKEEDKAWAFKRRIPTVVLYDEVGLRLYDRITSDAPEYYLFPDELNLLKTQGRFIARAMGFPDPKEEDDRDKGSKEEKEDDRIEREDYAEPKRWKPARWGDADVGKWNNGVNGEEGLGGGPARGWDVVELGAGALRKTGHLLTALSSALPPSTSGAPAASITYHPLDLSRPELHRVLGEMDEAFGPQLKGKVDCIGLHGDYEAGLQFIRDGKLESLRSVPAERGRGLTLNTLSLRDGSVSVESALPVTPESANKALDQSPPLTAVSEQELGHTPGPENSPLPSAMTCDNSSDSEEGTTWSPMEPVEAAVTAHSEVASVDSVKSAEWASVPSENDRPLHLVFLGSSIGNFDRDAAPAFLKSLPLRSGDTFLLGLDGRPAPGKEGSKKVEVAYNDPAGHTRAFEEHGWDVVRQELGLSGDAGVEFVGRYNEVLGRHESYFRSKAEQTLYLPGVGKEVTLQKNELLNIEWSNKASYSLREAIQLFAEADLRVVDSWKAPDSEYRLWVLERAFVRFTNPKQSLLSTSMTDPIHATPVKQAKGIPKWEEWEKTWKLWDHITLGMISKDMLHQKPIDLRHICLFYLGHIPTFLDIHLTRMTNGAHTQPEKFKDIFERGIDPDVDDPTKIHDHSEVPADEADWPTLDEILAFRDRVRERLRGIYNKLETGEMALTRHVGRVLFMTLEHEAMHAETLLYMLLQSPLTRAPTAVATPQWDALAKRWMEEARSNKVLAIPAGTIEMGHSDIESKDVGFPDHHGWADHEFGWDNEHPAVSFPVESFKVDALPISNAEYRDFLISSIKADLNVEGAAPASWIKVDGEWKVRTLYGPVGFDVAGQWPLMASKLELEAYARSKGGRLPTERELRMLWESEDGPRVAGEMANVGFKNWHPVPPTLTVIDNDGRTLHGHNGGVWEWTSTPFEGFEGYVPSKIYPGYSADFFDGKHFVVLGGSFATIPSIAGRKSFRNWYQANYRFSFIGGRVAYDV